MKKQRRVRSPRFVVPNNEQAVVSIGAEKLKGTLHMLSLTGGTIRLERRFASGTFADIGIQTTSGTFTAAIELLPMASGNAQAFRFIAMGPVARVRLNDGLSKMRAQGLGVEKTPLDQFRSLARRVLSVAFCQIKSCVLTFQAAVSLRRMAGCPTPCAQCSTSG